MPNTIQLVNRVYAKFSSRPTIFSTESILHTLSRKSRVTLKSQSIRMPSCVYQFTESRATNGKSWPSGVFSIMSTRTTFAGWFKCHDSTTSSRRTSCWNHSRRLSTTFSCHCSRPPTIQASIRNCTNSFNMSLAWTRLMMKVSLKIHSSILICRCPKTGPL